MGTRVYIGRLPYQVRERDVERFFKGYGRVREIMLKNGYGFVVSDLSYVQGLFRATDFPFQNCLKSV